MDITLVAIVGVALIVIAGLFFRAARFERTVAAQNEEIATAKAELLAVRKAAETAVRQIQARVDLQLAGFSREADRVREHYEAQALESQVAADQAVRDALQRLESMQKYQGVVDAEGEGNRVLTEALAEATSLKAEAQAFVELAHTAALEDRADATRRSKEILTRADALLDHATREAGRLVDEAHRKAQEIGGDAYTALREKNQLERAVVAIKNVIDGYGDRYIIPTRSVLDDLAAEFGHTQAGHELAAARDQTKRMVQEEHAADCEYAEANRRETAIRFVIDAFNGRVDAILSRTKHDNLGTLSQEMRDAFALVNQNGRAFREARILPAYLDARLAQLKWAVVVQELRLKEREEQRRIKEQMREEEKARREYERAIEETQREEAVIQKALEKAKNEAALANAGERAKFEGQIAFLNEKLAAAEAKNQRALSMAQQTRKGTVYIISNIGSFGEEVFKIGMTRRLEPVDRIKELSDASVPFEFDVHAMIACDDAPALESKLHGEFDELRLNKVNYRKEFFRMSLERLREVVTGCGVDASFTLLAEAREYRETQALGKMSPEERSRYRIGRESLTGA